MVLPHIGLDETLIGAFCLMPYSVRPLNALAGRAASAGAQPQHGGVPQCHVLVVEDDVETLEEFAELVEGLGYDCWRASDARSALRMIAEDSRIGIVVTDIQMPGMDGLSFLDQLSARFAFIRPIVPVVVTGHSTVAAAVQAMRANAIDFLSKPVSRDEYNSALRRASSRWAQMVGQLRLAMLTGAADTFSPGSESLPVESAPVREGPAKDPTDEELQALVRSLISSRLRRSDFFSADLFADPAWDILLDLASARLAGKAVPVSSACAAAFVPTSTALRWIRHLVKAGLVKRWTDPSDRRRDLVELNDHAMDAMRSYLVGLFQRRNAARLPL